MFERFLRYAKAAFMNEWHLLALVSGVAFSLIGFTGVLLPLVIAGEIIYMSSICTNPRFQRQIDAKAGDKDQSRKIQESQQRFQQLYFSLDGDIRQQFDQLRERCEIISHNLSMDQSQSVDKISDWQAQGINKLLWVYLKLAATKVKLAKFLKTIDSKQFDRQEKDIRKRLEAIPADPSKEKIRKSIEDTLKTIEARRANLAKAEENCEFIGLEMERIATKLTALSELSINRQDPSSITNEVDQVANSVESTEQAIGELNTFAGLIPMEEETAPQIVRQRDQNRIRI